MADPEVTIKMTAAAATAAKPEARAYVTTFLAGDGDEGLSCVVALAKALRKVRSAYPLVVAVLPGLPEARRQSLLSEGCVVREIEPVVYPPEPENQAQFAKLRTWEFLEFEHVVYLDASIIRGVPDNIDELFELEKGRFYAVAVAVAMNSSPSGEKAPPSHTTAGPPQYKQMQIGYYHQSSDNGEGRVLPPPLDHFNFNFKADMFVYEPGMATAEALLEALSVWPRSAPAADQQEDDDFFLYKFFGDRYERVLLENKPVVLMEDEVEVLVDISMPPDVVMQDKYDAWEWGEAEAPAGALAEHLRQLLPFAGVVALSAAANGLAAGPGSTAAAFGLFSLFLGGMLLVILHVLRRVAFADDE
ncbi:hypothetical protein BS78_07G067200 [Paspalum vaginatum]|nr:hypothetical protein BS78_07G067200 [Paspalum vaginatum]